MSHRPDSDATAHGYKRNGIRPTRRQEPRKTRPPVDRDWLSASQRNVQRVRFAKGNANGSLMTDADQEERETKFARSKDHLVVGSEHLGFAIALDRSDELADYRPA